MVVEVSQSLTGSYHFGVEASRVADRLQAIAEGIRSGNVIVHQLNQTQYTPTDDFQSYGIELRFVEKA